MSQYIKRQDAINIVAKQYRSESERMTALQELPAIEIDHDDETNTNKDFCEWKGYDYKTIASPHERYWSIPAMKDFKYCPYCQKRIKIVH